MRINIKILCICILFIAVIVSIQGVFASGFTSFTAYPLYPDTDSKVRLDWSDVAGAKTYEIYRDDVLIETIDKDTVPDPLTYTDDGSGLGLQPGTMYTYTVKAIAEDGSVIDTRKAVAQTSGIISPYDVKAVYNINSKRVTLTWRSSLHATGSIISRTVEDATTEIPVSSTTMAEIVETGNSPILYSIKSTTSGENSPDSYPVSITPIEAPTVYASVTNGAIGVSCPSYMHASYFQLERSKWDESLNTWGSWEVVKNVITGQGALDTPAEIGLYRYRMAAKSGSLYTGHSNITTAVKYLTAPSDLKLAITGSNTIVLQWVNNESWLNSTEAGLAIEVQRQENGTFVTISGSGLPKDANTFTDTVEITEGKEYTYRVRYKDAEQNYSTEAMSSITASLPAAPSSLHASVLETGVIRLSWQDNSNNETGFVIEKKTDSGSFEIAGTVEKNITSYTDSGVTAGHSYTYRVRAQNPLGSSGYSNQVSVSGWDTVSPSSLTVTPVSSNRIDLSWNYTGTTAYRTVIERKTGPDGEWRIIATTASGALKYSDTGLQPDTRYYYRIRKYVGEGVSGVPYPNNDVGIGVSTLLSGLSLTGTPFSNNTIYLSWTGNSAQADVIIERKMSNNMFSVIATVSPSTTGWYDNTGLIPGASYTYRVKAKSPSNESVYSNEVTVVNLFLDSPTVLTANADKDTGIELNWIDNSTVETGFEIWRSAYTSTNFVLLDTVGENTTSYTDTDVKKGVQYFYRVRAFIADEDIYSAYSNTASAGIGLIKPPEDLRYSYVSETSVTLQWKDVSDNESGFRVERKTGENGQWSVVSWLSANTTSYTMTGLDKNARYYVRIRAYRYSDNAEAVSEEIMVTTLLPLAPENVKATALSPTQIKIEWEDVTDSEEGYRILRRTPLGYYYVPVAEVGKDATSFIDTNLTPGTTYYYKVAAYNPAGSSESPVVSVQTENRVTVTFDDLGSVPWAREAIEKLAGEGIIKGVAKNLYNPMGTVTKAEFTALVVRAFGFDTTPVGTLNDVKPNKWYYREVMIAENFGLIQPDASNRFYPEKPITREEVCVLLVNALRESADEFPVHDNSVLEKYADRNIVSPSALASVAALVGEGIMEGTSSSTLSPKSTLTRAQAAVFVYRALNRYYQLQGFGN